MNMTELIEKDQKLYQCDECKATFKATEMSLVDPADNIIVWTPGFMIMCVEKDGTICGKQEPKKEDGDKLIACPKCGKIHISGFNVKS